ncbi:hypothetical protein [Paraburkholderia sediminicola]|uniref:hypothetical protein n=1 Tax=Paraburkholderia sediminicola TaxID=458836 RepID=UPI0038BC7ACA
MATMTTKKTTSRAAGWHVSSQPSSKALPAGQRVQETQNGLNRGTKSNDAGKQRADGGKPNGSLQAKANGGSTTSTEAPMGRMAKKLYPSAK